MNTQTVYQILKVFHIYGFIAMIGISIANVIAYQQFWRQYAADRAQGISTFQVIQKFQIAGMLGMISLLLAGLGMLAIHGALLRFSGFRLSWG